MRAVDLFSGAGGATLGLIRAGIEVVAGVEADPGTAAVYGELTGVDALVADVAQVTPADLPTFNLAWASPPCQPYSGRLRRGSADPRDGIGALMIFIERFRTDFLIVEEVPGFVRHREFHELRRELSGMGYTVRWRVLNAADFGVPQVRRRLIILAARGAVLSWPTPTHMPGNNLFGMPRWRGWGEVVRWEEAIPSTLPDWIVRRLGEEKGGLLFHPQLLGGCGYRRLGVYPGHRPAMSITVSGARSGIYATHPDGRSYRLGPRNLARLQALPPEPLTPEHIGNAVPPPLAEALARAVLAWAGYGSGE